jgi:hypothetical protein
MNRAVTGTVQQEKQALIHILSRCLLFLLHYQNIAPFNDRIAYYNVFDEYHIKHNLSDM